jgi:hypothetical protein
MQVQLVFDKIGGKELKRFNGRMHKAKNWIGATAKCFINIFVNWQHGFN